jgi:hypothetical protein
VDTEGTAYQMSNDTNKDSVTHITTCANNGSAWEDISKGVTSHITSKQYALKVYGTTPYVAISDSNKSGKLSVYKYANDA